MPSLIDSLESLISSIFGAITAVLGSIVAVFQGILNAILGVFQTFLSAIGTTVSGLAQTFEGLLKFLLSMYCSIGSSNIRQDLLLTYPAGNIVVIGGLIGAFFLYTVYQQRNGRSVGQAPAGTKKIN